MDVIEQREPSLDEVVAANKGIPHDDALHILDKLLATRQRQTANLADVLSQVVVWSSMLQSDKDELNRLISDGNGIDVYARILQYTDLASGKAHQSQGSQRSDRRINRLTGCIDNDVLTD